MTEKMSASVSLQALGSPLTTTDINSISPRVKNSSKSAIRYYTYIRQSSHKVSVWFVKKSSGCRYENTQSHSNILRGRSNPLIYLLMFIVFIKIKAHRAGPQTSTSARYRVSGTWIQYCLSGLINSETLVACLFFFRIRARPSTGRLGIYYSKKPTTRRPGAHVECRFYSYKLSAHDGQDKRWPT